MNRNTLTSAAYCAEPEDAAKMMARALTLREHITLLEHMPSRSAWIRMLPPLRLQLISVAITFQINELVEEMDVTHIMADPNDSVGTRD